MTQEDLQEAKRQAQVSTDSMGFARVFGRDLVSEIERLQRELAAAEALLQAKVLAGSGAYHQRINTEIEDYFRKKGTM